MDNLKLDLKNKINRNAFVQCRFYFLWSFVFVCATPIPDSSNFVYHVIAAVLVLSGFWFCAFKMKTSSDFGDLTSGSCVSDIKKGIVKHSVLQKQFQRKFISDSGWFLCFIILFSGCGKLVPIWLLIVAIISILVLSFFIQAYHDLRLEDFTEEEKKYIEEENIKQENN